MRKYASPQPLADMKRDASELRKQLEAPPDPKAAASARAITQKKLQKVEEKIASMTPPVLTGSRKDAAFHRANLLKQAVVGGGGKYPGMTTQHEERLNPYGAVDKHLRHQNFWNTHNLDENGQPVRSAYSAFNELQDTLLALSNSDGAYEDNPNAANLEMFRPLGKKPGLMDANPHIGEGTSFALSPLAKANYDQIFPDREKTEMERKLEEYEEELAREREMRLEAERLLKKSCEKPAPPITCAATTKAGKPCPTNPVTGSRYCMVHRKTHEE